MLPLIRTTLTENTDVAVESAPGLWSSLVDPSQLESAILNLTLNARDAMPAGGEVHFRLDNLSIQPGLPKPAYIDNELPTGDYVQLEVRDSGIGMDAEVRTRVFDPFFTTKQTGTGLGLSMVFGFVNQSGGRIYVASQPQAGTSVYLLLPRARAAEDDNSVDVKRSATAAQDTRHSTALLIEDNDPLRTLITHFLEELGFDVVTASGDADLARALHGISRLDLIVSDVLLPGRKKGPELVGAVLKDHPSCRVLYITGYSATADVSECTPVLHKPFSRQDFVNVIADLDSGFTQSQTEYRRLG